MQPDNVFERIPEPLRDETFQQLAAGANCRIERILSFGHATPPGEWYDQTQEEWVIVLQGRGRIEYEDGRGVEMGPGDYLLIPHHTRHRVAWTAPDEVTIWLAVHFEGDGAE